jgi:hypothetical protein
MGQERHMGKHLMIDELVGFRQLNRIVEHQNPAETRVLEEADCLNGSRACVDQPSLTQRKAKVVVQKLGCPTFRRSCLTQYPPARFVCCTQDTLCSTLVAFPASSTGATPLLRTQMGGMAWAERTASGP